VHSLEAKDDDRYRSPEGLMGTPDRDLHYGPALLAEFKALAAAQKTHADEVTTRARQAVAYLGAIFAVAQTAALSSFNQTVVTASERRTILDWAIAAAVGFGIAALLALSNDIFIRYDAVGEQDVERAADQAVEDDEDVSLILAKRYQTQVRNGEKPLKDKRRLLALTQLVAALALSAVVVEVIYSLSARLG
jgi:hypothetical protein